jgi:hypothetical protein
METRALCSNEGRIHLRRPILSLSFFACDKAADHTFRLSPSLGSNSHEQGPNNQALASFVPGLMRRYPG